MENNFPLIFTIFAFLSDFKIPALANDGGYHDNEKSIFLFLIFQLFMTCYSGNQAPNGQDLTRDTLFSLILMVFLGSKP